MGSMRRLAVLCLAAALAAAPALAQSTGDSAPSGPELRLPEKLDKALREMMDRMKPALDDLQDMLDVIEQIDSLQNYQKPEVLPNGDIIIRRRDDAPAWQPPDAPEEDEGDVKT